MLKIAQGNSRISFRARYFQERGGNSDNLDARIAREYNRWRLLHLETPSIHFYD
jgi:hypothetical protein